MKQPKNGTYTKGPWFAEGHSIFTRQGAYYIAELKSNANSSNSYVRGRLEAQANAQLIAAAPELLEALIMALTELRDVQNGETVSEDNVAVVVAKSERAIKKAKGE